MAGSAMVREMKLRSETTRSKAPTESRGVDVPDVGAGQVEHPRVGGDRLDELVVADVECRDVSRPSLEEHLGEPARARPDVEAASTLDVDRPGVESA